MADNAISAKIVADASGFRRGAKEASDATESLGHKIRELATEERQQNRLGSFLAANIEKIGFVSKGASEAVSELISGFAFGGGLGAATEGVKLLVKEFSKGGAEIKKFTDDAMASVKDLQKKVDDYIDTLRHQTEAQKLAHESIGPLEQKAAQLKDVLIARTDEEAAAQARLDAAKKLHGVQSISDAKAFLEIARAGTEEARRQLETTEQQLDLAKHQIGRAGAAGAASERAESDQEFHKAGLDHQIEDVAHYQQERKRLYDEGLSATEKKLQEVFDEEEQFRNRSLAADVEDAAHYQKIQQQKYDEVLGDTQSFFDKQERVAAQEAEKQAHEMASAAKEIGQAFGEAFKGMLDGTKSVGEALGQLVADIARAILQMAALNEFAHGDFIGGGILEAGSVLAGGLGSIFGGGDTNVTVNNTNHFQNANSSEVSLTMERSIVTAVRRLQARGRFT